MTTTHYQSAEKQSSRQEISVLPHHQPWLQNLQHKLLKNPQHYTTSAEIYSPQVQWETNQTQFDSFDYLRSLAQQGLDPTHYEDYQKLQSQMQSEVQRDLRVFLQEHYLLRHQSNTWDLDPDSILEDWITSGEKAVAKARVRRDESQTQEVWQTRHIKYRRFQLETQQITKMCDLITQFIDQQTWTQVAANTIFGESNQSELEKFGIIFPKKLPHDQLHPGRLQQLGLSSQDKIEVSPKFTLMMPANGFVHPGNLAYAVVYQVVRHQHSPGQYKYWLVSDHYYSQLTLEELHQTLNEWLPNNAPTNDLPSPKNPTEELLMQVVEAMPSQYTTTKPFLLFLKLAEKLDKEVSLPGGCSFAFEQKHLSTHLGRQENNLKQASALLTQILLTELALCDYYPSRQEYVGQILHDMFDKVVLALLHSTDSSNGEFTEEMYREILALYNQHYVSELLGEKLFSSISTNNQSLQPSGRSLAQTMADDTIYAHQEQSSKKWRAEFSALNNLFLLSLTSIPNATKGIFSCAACAGGMFGKMRDISQATGPVSGGVSNISSSISSRFGGSLPWYQAGLGWGATSGDVLGRDLNRDFSNRMNSFLNSTHTSASGAIGGFLNTVSAGELGTFMLVSEHQFTQLR